MRGRLTPIILLSLILAALAVSAAPAPTSAQPTWSFRVEILPARLYMGEWNEVYANITNVDCSERIDAALLIGNTTERLVRDMVARAEDMRAGGLLTNYTMSAERLWGVGGEVYGDYVLRLEGVCRGRGIEVTGAGLWLPVRGSGGQWCSGTTPAPSSRHSTP